MDDRADGHADRRRRCAGRGDKVEYRIDGGDFRRPTRGPFTVADPGEHVVEYVATDADGNIEATKRLAFRVDTAAPMPEASMSGNLDTGPVRVTLNTPDGDEGSGTVLTEYRVDGGPWTIY